MNTALPVDGLPDLMPDASTLYLTTSDATAGLSLREVLGGEQMETREPYPGVLAVPCTASSLHQVTLAWCKELSAADQHATKCRLSMTDEEPSLAELMQTYSLASLIAWVNGQWLMDVLKARRLVTYFQPIVSSGRARDVFAYECLLRGIERDGEIISPTRLYNAARNTGLLHALDQVARLTAIDTFVAYERDRDTCVFINMNPRSIEDPSDSLQTTLQAALSSGIASDRFVFEIVESDEITDLDGLIEIVEFCRTAGCRVALDDLGAGYSSLNLLTSIKPDFIKLDMDLIRNVDRDTYKSRVASKLLELAKELGVKTVAEGVETTGECEWSAAHGADYLQGYYFAHPAPVPPRALYTPENSDTIPLAGVADEVALECGAMSST